QLSKGLVNCVLRSAIRNFTARFDECRFANHIGRIHVRFTGKFLCDFLWVLRFLETFLSFLCELERSVKSSAIARRDQQLRLRFGKSLLHPLAATKDVPVAAVANRDVRNFSNLHVDGAIVKSVWLV